MLKINFILCFHFIISYRIIISYTSENYIPSNYPFIWFKNAQHYIDSAVQSSALCNPRTVLIPQKEIHNYSSVTPN